MAKANNGTPITETARMLREYAEAICQECMGDGQAGAYDLLLDAICRTDASEAEACCHMGRALILIGDGLADPAYRVGGRYCDPRLTDLSQRLGLTA